MRSTPTSDPAPLPIPSITVDAARARVSPHTVHVELAARQADGELATVLHLALSARAAGELAVLFARAAERCNELWATQAFSAGRQARRARRRRKRSAPRALHVLAKDVK